MANGEDGESPGRGRSSQPPVEGGPNLDATETGGMSSIDEGWGAGRSEIGELADNIRVVFENFRGEILKGWLAIAGAMFLVESAEVFIYLFVEMTGALGVVVSIFSWPIAVLVGFLSVLATAGQLTLYGPLRDKVFHGIEQESWTGLFRSRSGRFATVLGTVLALLMASSCTCWILGIGLIIAFFGNMAPYVAATEEIGVFDAFKKSYERAKRHWQVIAVTMLALAVGGSAVVCSLSLGGVLAGLAPELLGILLEHYATWVGVTVLQFVLFVIWGGVFVTVDAAETGQRIGA